MASMILGGERLGQAVATLEGKSERIETPCGHGHLVFRRWNGPHEHSEVVLLNHGGSGSWTHWFRNIEHLRRQFTVYTLDLPGLGDSASLPEGYTAEDAIGVVSEGVAQLPGLRAFHMVAFSWGCAVSAQVARLNENQLKSLMLVGPASIGDIPRRGLMKPLLKRTSDMNPGEIAEANRVNLARLMIQNEQRIDDMAVYLQTNNTNQARFNSPQFVKSTLVLDGVAAINIPVKVIYGEHDAPALPDIESKRGLFQAVNPEVKFEIIADAGHWLQYEQSDSFNALCEKWIKRNV
jgi:2-hydroxy-6-oxonona-2,4-dienedioate hydrolase